jgi:trigger factor
VEVSITPVSEVSQEVEITTSAQELEPHFEKAYRSYRAGVELKGFRKGKAPLDLVKRLYGDMIEHDSLGSVASTLYREVVKERDLKPIGEPVIVDMDYKRGEHFRFKVKYDIRPSITLKDYKKIPLERKVHEVTDKELDDEFLRLRRINSTLEEVSAVTDEEHVVTADVQELDPSGVPLIGKKRQTSRFYLADPELEQPIKDALMKAERDGQIKVSFQHQHGDHSHDVHLSMSVTKIERVALPPLDDALAAKVTKDKITTLGELKASIRKDLEVYWKDKHQRMVVNTLASEIVRRHDFQVPESLVRSVLDGLVADIKNQQPKKQLPEDFDMEKFYQTNAPYAVFQAKWALLREELMEAEGIAVEDADLEALAEKEAAVVGLDKERLLTFYKSSEQVQDRIMGDKLIDRLLGYAVIKEVPHTSTEDQD